MTRPRLLDLFCCAGGASEGYRRAGFDVTGVDVVRHDRYPFPFVQSDVRDLSIDFLRQFDAIHASPPCQFATALNNDKSRHENLIPPVRAMLEAAGRPYVIENVEAAAPHLRAPLTLCGTMFGLAAYGCELRRHRLFESNVAIRAPRLCQHGDGPVIGVYGGHARVRSKRHGGRGTRDVWPRGHADAMSRAMGMDWASCEEMSEAIPPAYTEWLGLQLMAALPTMRAAFASEAAR